MKVDAAFSRFVYLPLMSKRKPLVGPLELLGPKKKKPHQKTFFGPSHILPSEFMAGEGSGVSALRKQVTLKRLSEAGRPVFDRL